MGFYDRYILPSLINLACGQASIRRQREKVVPHAQGVVLELGFGSGLNLPYYDQSKLTKLLALEPAAGMLVRARDIVARADIPIEILPEPAEDLSMPPESVDTVLVTYSLCTIPDPVAALQGARRALRPEAGCSSVNTAKRRTRRCVGPRD